MRKDTKNFIASSIYDIETAERLFSAARYIYVIFLCHLAIEKLLKAIVAEILSKAPPKTHNLIYLLKISKIDLPGKLFSFVARINNASIITRYPEDLSRLRKAYPRKVADRYLKETREVIKWFLRDPRLKR